MCFSWNLICVGCVLLMASSASCFIWDSPLDDEAVVPATAIEEARARAILLHETVAGALQVVHRDLFDEDDSRAIPSASMEDVFEQLKKDFDVQLKWLVVETDVLNVNHEPTDDFERSAVTALTQGKRRFEKIENDRYRFAGSILLQSQCLKCHVKLRKDTEDRTAGLLISLPVKFE